jgi:hypothetical protein
MSEPRAIAVGVLSRLGILDMNAEVLRFLETQIDAWMSDKKHDEPLLIEVKRLISEQIIGLEIQDDFLVIGPEGKVFRVTKEVQIKTE